MNSILINSKLDAYVKKHPMENKHDLKIGFVKQSLKGKHLTDEQYGLYCDYVSDLIKDKLEA